MPKGKRIEIVEDGEVYRSYVELEVLRKIAKEEMVGEARKWMALRMIVALREFVDGSQNDGNVLGMVIDSLSKDIGLSRQQTVGVMKKWRFL